MAPFFAAGADGNRSMKPKPELAISPEKVCYLVVKAREFEAKDVVTDPNSGSNATDDAMVAVLEDHRDDPTGAELRAFIGALSEDEQIDLVALTRLGRGDGTIADWKEIRAETSRAHNNRTAGNFMPRESSALRSDCR